MNNQTLGLTVTRIALGVILFAHGYLLKIGTFTISKHRKNRPGWWAGPGRHKYYSRWRPIPIEFRPHLQVWRFSHFCHLPQLVKDFVHCPATHEHRPNRSNKFQRVRQRSRLFRAPFIHLLHQPRPSDARSFSCSYRRIYRRHHSWSEL
mgnify:CR=1 FL=1